MVLCICCKCDKYSELVNGENGVICKSVECGVIETSYDCTYVNM